MAEAEELDYHELNIKTNPTFKASLPIKLAASDKPTEARRLARSVGASLATLIMRHWLQQGKDVDIDIDITITHREP